MWAGGVVGLKSILGIKSRNAALETLEQLQELGYISYSLNSSNQETGVHPAGLGNCLHGRSLPGARGVYSLKRQRVPLPAPEHPG